LQPGFTSINDPRFLLRYGKPSITHARTLLTSRQQTRSHRVSLRTLSYHR
jgi:hypothetical protein